MIPFIVLFIRFEFDNKFHSKDQIDNLLINQIPVITEIPYITDKETLGVFLKIIVGLNCLKV